MKEKIQKEVERFESSALDGVIHRLIYNDVWLFLDRCDVAFGKSVDNKRKSGVFYR